MALSSWVKLILMFAFPWDACAPQGCSVPVNRCHPNQRANFSLVYAYHASDPWKLFDRRATRFQRPDLYVA